MLLERSEPADHGEAMEVVEVDELVRDHLFCSFFTKTTRRRGLSSLDEDVAIVADGLGPTLLLAGQVHLREDLLGEPVVRAGSAEGVEVWGDERTLLHKPMTGTRSTGYIADARDTPAGRHP